MKVLLIVPLLLALAGCNSPNDPGVGGVTRSEAEALNDAAAMLDNNAVAPVAEPGNGAAAK
jgi:hypothetical protein